MRLSAVVSGNALSLISAVHADHGRFAASHLLRPVPGNLVTNSVTRPAVAEVNRVGWRAQFAYPIASRR